MKSKITILILFFSFSVFNIYSQTPEDAFRLSNDQLLGTARSLGTNTTMSAIGGDFISVSSNPAGLAQFSFSEFMISTGLAFNNTSSVLQGDGNAAFEGTKARFKVPNIGLVIAAPRPAGQKNKFVFGIGYNSSLAINRDYSWKGKSKGSITERFAALANGLSASQLDNYEGGPAYDTYILVKQRNDGSWVYDYEGYENIALEKEQIVSIKSVNSELALSGGLKSGDKLFAGFTLGVPFNSYTEHRSYYERDSENSVPYFGELRFRDFKKSSGVGINAKAGIMYRPISAFSVGLAIHTPTLLSQKEDFDTGLYYTFQDSSGSHSNESLSPEGTINYRITTPMKLIGSIGTIISKSAFLNAELSYSDASQAKVKVISDEAYDKETERQINSEIKSLYTSALRINIGGEYAFKNGFRIRGGYGMAQSGLKSDDKFYPSFAAGLGYRKDYFYLDLAYKQFKSKAVTAPYLISGDVNQTKVNQEYKDAIILLTFGLKFF